MALLFYIPETLILLKIDFNKIKAYNKIRGVKLRMAIEIVPEWMRNLEEEDVVFLKKFVLASGSLKEIASQYGVTYPTVRLRLDRLIQKIKMEENQQEDPYILLIKRMAVNGKMDFETAKILIQEYRKKQQEEKS